MKATWLGSLRLSPESPVRLTPLTPKSSISLRSLCGSWVKSEASSTPTCGYLCSRVPCLDRPRYRTGMYHVRPLGWAARGRSLGWTPWLYSSQCCGAINGARPHARVTKRQYRRTGGGEIFKEKNKIGVPRRKEETMQKNLIRAKEKKTLMVHGE